MAIKYKQNINISTSNYQKRLWQTKTKNIKGVQSFTNSNATLGSSFLRSAKLAWTISMQTMVATEPKSNHLNLNTCTINIFPSSFRYNFFKKIILNQQKRGTVTSVPLRNPKKSANLEANVANKNHIFTDFKFPIQFLTLAQPGPITFNVKSWRRH